MTKLLKQIGCSRRRTRPVVRSLRYHSLAHEHRIFTAEAAEFAEFETVDSEIGSGLAFREAYALSPYGLTGLVRQDIDDHRAIGHWHIGEPSEVIHALSFSTFEPLSFNFPDSLFLQSRACPRQ